jgi:hypothetical protein
VAPFAQELSQHFGERKLNQVRATTRTAPNLFPPKLQKFLPSSTSHNLSHRNVFHPAHRFPSTLSPHTVPLPPPRRIASQTNPIDLPRPPPQPTLHHHARPSCNLQPSPARRTPPRDDQEDPIAAADRPAGAQGRVHQGGRNEAEEAEFRAAQDGEDQVEYGENHHGVYSG